MGITGATVGQIAKVAAVDASGVPTAWSPVDMPSGVNEAYVTAAITAAIGNIDTLVGTGVVTT